MRLLSRQGLPFDVIRHLLAERASVVRGYPGTRGAMWAAALADPRAESALESVVRGRVIEARLPAPALQVEVVGRSGRRYRCDLGLRRPDDRSGMTGLLIEADGLGKYTRPDDLAEEKRRQHDIEAEGYDVLRVLYVEAVHVPADFVARVRRALGRQI